MNELIFTLVQMKLDEVLLQEWWIFPTSTFISLCCAKKQERGVGKPHRASETVMEGFWTSFNIGVASCDGECSGRKEQSTDTEWYRVS